MQSDAKTVDGYLREAPENTISLYILKGAVLDRYRDALAMLREAIENCPEEMWLDTSYKNPFWAMLITPWVFSLVPLSLEA